MFLKCLLLKINLFFVVVDDDTKAKVLGTLLNLFAKISH